MAIRHHGWIILAAALCHVIELLVCVAAMVLFGGMMQKNASHQAEITATLGWVSRVCNEWRADVHDHLAQIEWCTCPRESDIIMPPGTQMQPNNK